MPYVSKAQRRLFHAKLARGEISAATVKHWDRASRGLSLPERSSTTKKGSTNMAKRRKHKKARKTSKKRKTTKRKTKRKAGAWSATKLAAYKRAKRNLIKRFSRSSSGKVSISG
jgi:hypothetical protein